MAKDRRRARNWTVGIALAALLAGGGVIAGVALGSPTLSSAPAASTSSAGTGSSGTGSTGTGSTGTGSSGGTASSGATGQAALLDSTLNAADSPDATVTTTGASAAATGGPATGTGAAVAGPLARRCARAVAAARAARLTGHPVAARRAAAAAIVRCRFLRRRIIVRFFLLRGIDGEFTFRTASGTIRTLAYERGVIESVNGSTSITVQGEDGTTSTWDLVSNTVVRELSGKVSESSLAAGEPVWVGGPVVNGVRDARLIFVRPPSS